MARPQLPPIFLAELREQGIPVSVDCPVCHRRATIAATEIPLPDEADMSRLEAALKCGGCGRRGGISACPESIPWVRWLKRTGQRDRLP